MLHIQIGDTGVGIDEEKLQIIRNQIRNNQDSQKETSALGIGIGNISRRIRSMYENASFTIDSGEGEGCLITIDIPFRGKE